ncbi:MAG: TPM domain-containing protein [Phycisphaerae bacterium]|nr:TPM domain-containing protein [Phycisphaerae bacterium]
MSTGRTSRWRVQSVVLSVLTVLSLFVGSTAGQVRYPAGPPPGSYIVDEAGMVDPADAAAINAACAALHAEKQIPILVCTIASVADYGAWNVTVDKYAELVFNNWGIGTREYNFGILLLISKNDRKARIELGAGWKHDYDEFAAEVMNNLIVPNFKRGRFSEGVRVGVDGLRCMATGQAIPSRPIGQRFGDVFAAGWQWARQNLVWVLVPLFMGGSMVYNRYAYGMWFPMHGRGGWSGGDGGYGGGGFGGGFGGGGGWGGGGGGFSGGGGASGGW